MRLAVTQTPMKDPPFEISGEDPQGANDNNDKHAE